VLLLPLAAGGCGLTESGCPESRDVTAATSQSTSLGSDYAQVGLSQYRGTPGVLSWRAANTTLLQGEVDPFPLQQHVFAARLLDAGADMAVLLDLPLRPIAGWDGVGGDLTSYAGPPSFDQLFALVQAGRAVLELVTDIPGEERVLRRLGTVFFTDWRRLQCD